MDSRGVKFLVGVDGSETSELCWELAINDLIRVECDTLVIANIFD